MSIPWLTKSAFTCQALICGGNESTRKDIRATVVRYMDLAWILSLMNLSQKVKQRFWIAPTIDKRLIKFKERKPEAITIRQRINKINSDKVVKQYFGKLILEDEIYVFENFEKHSKKPTYIIPLMWETKLIEKSFKSGYITSERIYLHFFNIIQDFRSSLGSLSVYNEFNVPLVYTQVTVIVVYTFLISEIFTQQLIEHQVVHPSPFESNSTMTRITRILNTYLPVFGIFKFLSYMGWFKVGLSFINPFGKEQSDLPLDSILDYNLEVFASVSRANDFYFQEYLCETFKGSDDDRFVFLCNINQ